jgi:hypothetical protein
MQKLAKCLYIAEEVSADCKDIRKSISKLGRSGEATWKIIQQNPSRLAITDFSKPFNKQLRENVQHQILSSEEATDCYLSAVERVFAHIQRCLRITKCLYECLRGGIWDMAIHVGTSRFIFPSQAYIPIT